jgi:hypothetical protein
MTTTSVIGNAGGIQLHFATSTGTIAATAAADATRLAANEGSYREGDAVICVCTDGLLIGEVASTGAIAQFFTAA